MSYRIHLDDLDLDFPCDARQNVLECMMGSGKNGIPVGCRGGGCGVCQVQVVEGEYDARPMSKAHIDDKALAQRRVLACCIRPRSDLSLKVIGKLARPIHRRCQKSPKPDQ
ncbi:MULTISPECIES: 2Fe-2S iron-sulfur cluster-binding protein [unclassified Marinobacter]|uniref:2Fe-2S iron-sulfur cluster-binding protein n=1 Tax=unclassified Marinobacter TaxID=83889 RepID=UPI001928105F|nr:MULTISPECIES: 2Fe-2S iron-sulfur cluster-binding protein [unclassified Marinobacter]MBL3827384.1 2Fe-2S iron-sulfur cluster binding domain-containing protein [Marinobacter sp. MC3]MBL3895902.1 2Fe-2S iron-sulfur cluster binding domain-containing protein [Marinobacter sp. MW3]